MSYDSVLIFIFEEIYDGLGFSEFKIYYDWGARKYAIWYQGMSFIARITISSLFLFWSKVEYMKSRYFLILITFYILLIIFDLVYIIYQWHQIILVTGYILGPILDYGVAFIIINLMQLFVVFRHLFKTQEIIKEFDHYAYYSPRFYDKWIISLFISLILLGSFGIMRFLFFYILGSSFDGDASFSTIFHMEYHYQPIKFYSNLIYGPVGIITGVMCYLFSRKQNTKEILSGFIACSLIQFIGYILFLVALYESITRAARKKDYLRAGRHISDTLFAGTVCSLVIIAMGLFYNNLKEENSEEQTLLLENERRYHSSVDSSFSLASSKFVIN